MKVIEFWLSPAHLDDPFPEICRAFYARGPHFSRAKDGRVAGAVYAVSRNTVTGWVQLLIDDNAPAGALTAVEAILTPLKNDTVIRSYDWPGEEAPMETPEPEG